MSQSVGRLLVEFSASFARFESDLGKAASSAEAASRRIDAAIGFARAAGDFPRRGKCALNAALIRERPISADSVEKLCDSLG